MLQNHLIKQEVQSIRKQKAVASNSTSAATASFVWSDQQLKMVVLADVSECELNIERKTYINVPNFDFITSLSSCYDDKNSIYTLIIVHFGKDYPVSL